MCLSFREDTVITDILMFLQRNKADICILLNTIYQLEPFNSMRNVSRIIFLLKTEFIHNSYLNKTLIWRKSCKICYLE
jgi:hypothetical protein